MRLKVELWKKRKWETRLAPFFHDNRVRDALIDHIFRDVEYTNDTPCNREVIEAMANAHGCTIEYVEGVG